MTDKLKLLKNIEVGARVAEDEVDDLEKYFVETDQWSQMRTGKIDVVYGPKGSGKSALYTLLNRKENELFDDNILIASGENVRGNTVFSSLVNDPPPTEMAFIYLWKLYCLTLIGEVLREYTIKNDFATSLVSSLERSGLLPTSNALSAIFRSVSNYLKGWINRDAQAVEYAISINPSSGAPTASRKTEFREQSDEQNLAEIPADELLFAANEALSKEGLSLWILFDRLDVAFADSPDMERNALRALFRTYNNMKGHSNISLKIFVRDDIWERITEGGFTEASHITKTIDISWSEETLLNLVILRLLNNSALVDYLDVDVDSVKNEYEEQKKIFYTIAPEKIDTGRNPETFGWMISRISDSTNRPAPREVIHMLEEAKKIQIQKLERGEQPPEGSILLERPSFKEALPQVSKTKFQQTLLAEYSDVGEYLKKLEGEKTEQSIESLSKIWDTDRETTIVIARRLVNIGFFIARGEKDAPNFWVPFLYRPALGLVQGKAA